jgi:hypothetical protein
MSSYLLPRGRCIAFESTSAIRLGQQWRHDGTILRHDTRTELRAPIGGKNCTGLMNMVNYSLSIIVAHVSIWAHRKTLPKRWSRDTFRTCWIPLYDVNRASQPPANRIAPSSHWLYAAVCIFDRNVTRVHDYRLQRAFLPSEAQWRHTDVVRLQACVTGHPIICVNFPRTCAYADVFNPSAARSYI